MASTVELMQRQLKRRYAAELDDPADDQAVPYVEVEVPMVLRAISLARRHTLSLWDALIVEAALRRGCTRLLSEDMQDGRRFGDLTIENPFA